MLTTPFGSKLGLHAIYPQRVLPMVRALHEAGGRWALVKGVDNAGIALDVKAVNPQITTVTRFVTPQWDSCQTLIERGWPADLMQSEAQAVIGHIFDRTNADERRAADYFEVLNEADPPDADHWEAFGLYLKLVCAEATRRGIKLLLPGFNYGTPEYSEMQAFVKHGLFSRMKSDGHLLAVHEGVDPFSPDNPLVLGPIPGAPSVPLAGPFAGRHNYLYHLLRQRDEVVPCVVSEYYAGGGYGDVAANWTRLVEADRFYRQLPHAVAVLAFTVDPIDGWRHQDYTPTLDRPEVLEYLVTERGKANAAFDVVVDPPSGYTHRVANCLALNVRLHPWAGRTEPPKVRQLSRGAPVTVHGWFRDTDMRYGWAEISGQGNEWVSGQYLSP